MDGLGVSICIENDCGNSVEQQPLPPIGFSKGLAFPPGSHYDPNVVPDVLLRLAL
jgi:hypothetical protein